jgi:hypothetical protein
MIELNQIDIRPWITERFVLSDVPSHLKDLAAKSDHIKALIEVEDSDV